MELVFVLAMSAALWAALLFQERDRQAWRAERADLLNRLMVKDWTEYQALSQTPEPVVVESLTTDEAEARWAAERPEQETIK